MLKKKLVIVEDNAMTADMLKEVIEARTDWQVVGTSGDGKQSADVIMRTRPDLVLLDLILPGCDGFSVMETVRGENLPCKFFVLSSLSEENMMRRALTLGASFYMTKPFDTDILVRRIDELFSETTSLKRPLPPRDPPRTEWERLIKEYLYNYFLDLGISVLQHGFKYLMTGIVFCANDPDLLNNISKYLYPKLAKVYGVDVRVIEHSCRYSLDTAWRCGHPELYCETFKCKRFTTYKPSNGEFLRMMTDKILLLFPEP